MDSFKLVPPFLIHNCYEKNFPHRVGGENYKCRFETPFLHINFTPAQKEYAKAYNRLKARKQRGKITVDEWNATVAMAQNVKDQAEHGELSDEELRRQLRSL